MIEHCSSEILEAALGGTLTSHQEIEVHRHLEACDSCCLTMEQLAGGADFCHQAAAQLANDPLDETAPSREEWSTVDFGVELLDPSEDPNALGSLGGYQILELIGRGGMGVVMKGFDPELKRYVAIKALAPNLSHSSLARKRFAREAQAAAAVVNPHVMAIHQVQSSGRLPFLVMPLLAGESLAQRLAARGHLELTEILRISMQSALGLAAAHEQGLVHRDVKPANILLEKGVERAVLTDFGLARAADDVSMTRFGVIAGTPQYMSPEQARGEALDSRSDLFSLGCVLYEMATGVSPFRAESTMATLMRVVNDRPKAIASLNPDMPPWFIGIVERLLEKNPRRRFASAKEVGELLERCLAHVQQPAVTNIPQWLECYLPQNASSSRRRRLRSRILGGSGIGFVLLVALAGWWSPMFGFVLTPAEAKATSESNLHRLTTALLAYEQEHGHYPAGVIYGKDGQGGPPHSWRIEILPYLGYKSLYAQYRMDEAWDSPHNSTVLAQMPDVYRAPQGHRRSTSTSYFGVLLEEPRAVFQRSPNGDDGSSSSVPAGLSANSTGGGSGAQLSAASAEFAELARRDIAAAQMKLQNWKQLHEARTTTEQEGDKIRIELEQARIELAVIEKDRQLLLASLDCLVELRQAMLQRMKLLQGRGAIALDELDAAEIDYLEARIQRSSAKSDFNDLVNSMSQVATISARRYERMKQLLDRKAISDTELKQAETEWRRAAALHRIVSKMPFPSGPPGTTAEPADRAAVSFHDDLNQIHQLGPRWSTEADKSRCQVCHEATQVQVWSMQHAADRLMPPDFNRKVAEVEMNVLEARRKAASQWRVAMTTDDRRQFIRRISLDLIGRLPTTEEIARFERDKDSNAVDKLIDRLLANDQLPDGDIADGLFVPRGSTLFSRPRGARQIEITDGTMNTIALVECRRDTPWTKPDDLVYEPGRSPGFGGWYEEGWYAGLADGRVCFLRQDAPEPTVRAWLTINGNEQSGASGEKTQLPAEAANPEM